MENPIVTHRIKKGISTRQELARRAGFSYESCTLYEGGLRKSLSARALKMFASVLDVEPEVLQEQYRTWRAGLVQA